MLKSPVKNRYEIEPEDIKFNIYDYVELVVDTNGITTSDIIKVLPQFNELLPQEKYQREDSSLTMDEINDYADRQDNPISMFARKRYMEDMVIRYITEDAREVVSISRLFTSIYLAYDVAHTLKDSFKQIGKIIDILNTLDYFVVRKIYLIKSDSIYCTSLENLYNCFDKEMFADTAYKVLQKDKNLNVDTGTVQICNSFTIDGIDIFLKKTIMAGNQPDSTDIIYRGELKTIISSGGSENKMNIEDCFHILNRKSFEMFMYHITDNFAQDLITGNSKYVMRGMNQYA